MTIRCQIIDFFHQTIQYTYANNTIHNYVFDVYIDKNDRVWLIDFNIWADRTDTLLFSWEEIINITNKVMTNSNSNDKNDNDIGKENVYPEIRVVMEDNQVKCDPLSSYRVPIDTVDLASEQFDTHSFQEFMAMCQPPSAQSDSEESEDSD